MIDGQQYIIHYVKYFIFGIVSSTGAMVNFLYQLNKGKLFTFISFVTSLFIGFYVGALVGSLFSDDFKYRDAILLLTGFASYNIIQIIDARIKGILYKVVEVVELTSEIKNLTDISLPKEKSEPEEE